KRLVTLLCQQPQGRSQSDLPFFVSESFAAVEGSIRGEFPSFSVPGRDRPRRQGGKHLPTGGNRGGREAPASAASYPLRPKGAGSAGFGRTEMHFPEAAPSGFSGRAGRLCGEGARWRTGRRRR